MAQAIPPSAFQKRKTGHRMWLIPASHADVILSQAIQRPRNTAFGPCRSKNGSPLAMSSRR